MTAIIWGDQAKQAGKEFMGEETRFYGTINSFVSCIVLNGQGSDIFGIFIKQEDLSRIGWDKSKSHNGKVRNHQFHGTQGKTPGLLFENPYLYVVDQSERWIEIRRDKEKMNVMPEAGKDKEIVGVHASREGVIDPINAALYDELKAAGIATLRNIYLIFFTNEQGEILHKVPVALSVHGGASYSISQALNAAKMSFGTPLSVEGFSHYIWHPQFTAELVGSGKQQYCTVVASNDEGFIQNIGIVVDGLDELSKQFEEIRKANNNFSWRYFNQFADYHPIAKQLQEAQNPAKLLHSASVELDLPDSDIPY